MKNFINILDARSVNFSFFKLDSFFEKKGQTWKDLSKRNVFPTESKKSRILIMRFGSVEKDIVPAFILFRKTVMHAARKFCSF